MNSLQYVSFSDEVTPQSNQIYLRQEQENVTSIPQINQSVQYSMIQPQYLNNTVNYDVVNIKKNQKRNQNLDLDIIIQKNTTLQSNHSKPLESIGITELDTNIMNNFDSSQQIENFKKQSQTQRFNQFNQTNAFANMYQSEKKKNQFKDISSHEESLPSPDTPVQLKADDLQTTKIQTTQRFQESELSLKKEERQQIMNQSLIKFQEAKKAIVNKNKFSSSISPQFDESFLLKVSSARVLEDEIYHQKIDQDLIQKQKIRSSLTQMEEDELDGLIQLLNSGN
ncbi:hypothetical protein SS50377_25674 [Spironucleus salmonicida]|nr:hypothetical protein SS50377_25674 [Spironucleus salmonicida]